MSPLCYRPIRQLPLIRFAQDSTGQIDNKVHGLWELGLSPIYLDKLQYWLSLYPNPLIAHELLHGFRHGFSLQYTGLRIALSCKNLVSANEHQNHLLAELQKEIQLGRILGPLKNLPFQIFIVVL